MSVFPVEVNDQLKAHHLRVLHRARLTKNKTGCEGLSIRTEVQQQYREEITSTSTSTTALEIIVKASDF